MGDPPGMRGDALDAGGAGGGGEAAADGLRVEAEHPIRGRGIVRADPGEQVGRAVS